MSGMLSLGIHDIADILKLCTNNQIRGSLSDRLQYELELKGAVYEVISRMPRVKASKRRLVFFI